MESRLSASPSSHLPNMSQEERLEFSVFLSGIRTGCGAGSGMGQRKARSRREALCVFYISGEIVRISEPALVGISLFVNKRAAYFLLITRLELLAEVGKNQKCLILEEHPC